MKRTISFLLVMMMVLASLACTSKTEPIAFTPLEAEFRKAELTAFPGQRLSLTGSWDEAKARLSTADWVSDNALVSDEQTLVVLVTDTKNNTYAFHDAETPYVIVTRNSDEKTFGFKITTEMLDAFDQFTRAELVKQVIQISELSGLLDLIDTTRSLHEKIQLTSVSYTLKTKEWEMTSDLSPQDGTEAFTMWTKLNDQYTLYLATPQSFAIVTRSDQSTYAFFIPDTVIPEITAYVIENNQSTIDSNPTPMKVYIGTRSGYSDQKLVTIPSEAVANYVEKRESNGETFQPIDSALIDPDAPILFMTKNTDGTYTTVYADESTAITQFEWFYKVSIGKDPFHGPENLAFINTGSAALMDYALLALFSIDSTSSLDFHIDTQATYTFPHWYDLTGMGDIRPVTTTGKLNLEMIDYLNSLEKEATLDELFDPAYSLLGFFHFIVTSVDGTIYRFVYDGVFVDEDPQTPGAIFYRFNEAVGYPYGPLEYFAKLPATTSLSSLTITQYYDNEGQGAWIDLTSAQSAAISSLIQDSAWNGSLFRWVGGGPLPEMVLKTSSGEILYFLYFEVHQDQYEDYVLLRLSTGHWFYVPLDQFNDIYALFKTFLP